MKSLYKSILASVLSLLTAVSFIVPSFAADVRYGDVNSDGKINSTDALTVLKHSVGPEILNGDASVLADVNGDGKINSTDALEILLVSVGKRAKFTVEVNIPAPTTKEAVLGIYADAIAKARNDIPSYKLKTSSKTKDAQISGALVTALPSDAVEELKQGMMTSESYQNILRKGTDTALNNLPLELAVKDPSKFKNVTSEVLSDGNYKVVIDFYNENNPKAGSTITKVMNLPDFDMVKKEFEEEMNSVGSEVPATVDLKNMNYENCQIICVVDSTSGEIISMTFTSDMVVSLTMTMVFSMNVNMTTNTVLEYSNFGY